jgi:hypothetical protein
MSLSVNLLKFRLIAINFSLLSPTFSCELSEREVTFSSNLKVVRALLNVYHLFILDDIKRSEEP